MNLSAAFTTRPRPNQRGIAYWLRQLLHRTFMGPARDVDDPPHLPVARMAQRDDQDRRKLLMDGRDLPILRQRPHQLPCRLPQLATQPAAVDQDGAVVLGDDREGGLRWQPGGGRQRRSRRRQVPGDGRCRPPEKDAGKASPENYQLSSREQTTA